MKPKATSPASSGPAGSHFEGQVGAYYLLSMLADSEPRGLPGTVIDRIEFQRAPEGHPLDDVVVHAHDMRGNPALIEIQVKRTIAFSPGDTVFRAVVDQIVKASRGSDFWEHRYELAIATARTSRKIDSAYQDVLTWARQIDEAKTFMARIGRPGSANPDMRTFVSTFKSHLHDAGSPDDDETVWRLLRKLQILVFDFTAQGSATEELAKERAIRALHSKDTLRAGNLWTTLIEFALQVAASGGDRTREGLVEDLARQSFHLAGLRHNSSARAILAEDSRNALADIGDRVGEVTLTRLEHVAAVRAAFDNGRYIEIRGDAGVGKSGILKHFAEQISAEARIIVLSPWRTTPGGWTAMRAILGFDGTARDLLADLACDGGGILFIDNIDFLGDEERRTAVDLVRAAASVAGVSVVTTARSNFAVEEPNWLPSDALTTLGCSEPVVIGELNQIEIEELRHAAPRLSPLLTDTHPARYVIRNLFRLSRLANRLENEPAPRTEVDMAEQWWRTADGRLDGDHRERARLLRVLAEQSLEQAELLDVSDRPAGAVDSLVTSETLRDFGGDRVAFRHDVLREWAIANLLHSSPAKIERLPLDCSAPAALARGVELAARLALEHVTDNMRWESILERLSREGTHGSWRRAVLLAVVRSETGFELLTRVSSILLANSAKVLRELIRIMMAVEVEPASRLFATAGFDTTIIPAGLNVPSGPAWYRLILWLLGLGQSLPVPAIPDVVDLYTTWSNGMLGRDSLTPLLMHCLYHWLIEIEVARDVETSRDCRRPFGGEIDRDRIGSLESDLRTCFLIFCSRTPDLAVEYLRSLNQRRRNENVLRSILKFPGGLAQAAPAELADLTAVALIPKHVADDEPYHHRERNEPFDFIDLEFLPVSPAQGPFLDLLTHAPQHGLSLIRRLVDHAISFYSRGREYGDDAITISLSDGERAFPWEGSYAWSREGAGHYSVRSALMALEAWAHQRIEAGESFDTVLDDVLGMPGSPAAYLLVAVDLLLSHWPQSCEAAVPFLACPKLLCIDLERLVHDNIKHPDIFGFEALQKEPVGRANLQSLKSRPSRRLRLDHLLGKYVELEQIELRENLITMLRRASARLEPPDERSTLADANLMAAHAINLLDPNNWQDVFVSLPDGTQTPGMQYIPPDAEERHFARLQQATRDRLYDTNMQADLASALEDPSSSSPEFAAAAVAWAQSAALKPSNEDTDKKWMREESVLTAATIAIRDGEPELRKFSSDWARSVFAQALQTEEDPVYRFRSGLCHNPIAIAFVGLIHLLKDHADIRDVRTILEVAASGNPAAAYGFGGAAMTLASVDERLPRAVLRCAFAACIRAHRDRNLTEGEASARCEQNRKRIQVAVDAELAWLAGERPEPDWPAFPSEVARRRPRFRLKGAEWELDAAAPKRARQQVMYADHQAAALWLNEIRTLGNVTKRSWLRDMARTYAAWTFTANGAGLDVYDEIDNPPREWNNAFFKFLAHCLPNLTMPDIELLALAPISSLPDRSFLEILPQFLRSIDAVYFNDCGLQDPIATSIRFALAKRLMESNGWKRLGGSPSASIEMHIGPAIAVLFFNDHGFSQPAKCYLFPQAIDRIAPFFPVLKELVEGGPSLFVALVTLNLLEVAPKPAHLPIMVLAAKTWMKNFPDNSEFWVDHDFGHRVCAWIENVWHQEPDLFDADKAERSEVDRLLAALVSLGVADARRLEEALARGQGSVG